MIEDITPQIMPAKKMRSIVRGRVSSRKPTIHNIHYEGELIL